MCVCPHSSTCVLVSANAVHRFREEHLVLLATCIMVAAKELVREREHTYTHVGAYLSHFPSLLPCPSLFPCLHLLRTPLDSLHPKLTLLVCKAHINITVYTANARVVSHTHTPVKTPPGGTYVEDNFPCLHVPFHMSDSLSLFMCGMKQSHVGIGRGWGGGGGGGGSWPPPYPLQTRLTVEVSTACALKWPIF